MHIHGEWKASAAFLDFVRTQICCLQRVLAERVAKAGRTAAARLLQEDRDSISAGHLGGYKIATDRWPSRMRATRRGSFNCRLSPGLKSVLCCCRVEPPPWTRLRRVALAPPVPPEPYRTTQEKPWNLTLIDGVFHRDSGPAPSCLLARAVAIESRPNGCPDARARAHCRESLP